MCNRIGSTERAASSAYHGIGAWGERRQLTSWPSRSTALLFYCLPPHLPTSPPLHLPPSPPPHLSGCRYQALSGTISCPSTQEQDGTGIYLLAAISGSVLFCIKAAKLQWQMVFVLEFRIYNVSAQKSTREHWGFGNWSTGCFIVITASS